MSSGPIVGFGLQQPARLTGVGLGPALALRARLTALALCALRPGQRLAALTLLAALALLAGRALLAALAGRANLAIIAFRPRLAGCTRLAVFQIERSHPRVNASVNKRIHLASRAPEISFR